MLSFVLVEFVFIKLKKVSKNPKLLSFVTLLVLSHN